MIAELLVAAEAARANAMAPLTGVRVGAALRTANGVIIPGCNIESPSAIFGCCAERTALFTALAAGHRQFTHVAVMSDFPKPIPPCGFCRQALLEFAPDLEVIMAALNGQVTRARIADLVPLAYRIEDRA